MKIRHGAIVTSLLQAATLLVKDVLSTAVTYVNHGPDAKFPESAHVWTPSAIRAASRIVVDVTDEAVSTAQERSASQRLPILQLPDDAEQDQRALVVESSARFDKIGIQPSSIGMQPSDMVSLDSNFNNAASEPATNDNANNRATRRRGSGSGFLGQLFGRRRRNV